MGGNEQNYVQQAFDTNWIAPLGPNVQGFEDAIREYFGEYRHVAALSSGTASLHLGLILLGVGPGDEVICQSLTFSASANPIKYLGADPVFVDSERKTWNISPELTEQAIQARIAAGKKPKAIVPVHLYGMPYQGNEIREIADRYEIPILEDSAEALGSRYLGMPCGSLGDLAVLSFNGNKIITTSGGGALLSSTKEFKDKAIYLSTQARDPAPHYQHSEVGYNYRLSNVLAGIGRGQMEVLDRWVEARRSNYEFYLSELSGLPGIEFLSEPEGYFSNRWLTCILTDSYDTRERLRKSLEEVNIESRPLWKPMHMQPVFRSALQYTDGTSEDLFDRGLCLPSGSNMTASQRERVRDRIFKAFGR